MSFFDRFRREKALTATPAVIAALRNNSNQMGPLLGVDKYQQRVDSVYVEVQNASYGWIYCYNPAVRRVVDYIARNAAQLNVHLYRRKSDNEREHVGEHPAAKTIRQPNPQTPGQHFILALFIDWLTYQNAYALKVPDQGRTRLYNVDPSIVGLVGRNYFEVEAYRIWNPLNGEAFDVPPERMLHWRGHAPNTPKKGESYLRTLQEELASDAAARQSVTELHRSGLPMAAWLERPIEAPELDPAGLRNVRESTTNWAKKGKRELPVLEEGMALKTASVTPEDAEYIKTREWTNAQVASLFGMKNVPPENAEETRQFYADVLPPLTELCSTFLDLHILQNEYGLDDYYFEFGREKLLDETVKTYTSASGRPVYLTNEARARLDLPPVPDGDELVTPGNVIVGEKPSPMVMPIQNPNGPPQDGSYRSGEADQPRAAGRRALNGGDPWAYQPANKLLVPRHAAIQRRRDGYMADVTVVTRKFVKRWARSIAHKAARDEQQERFEEEFAADLFPVVAGIVAQEGTTQAHRVASSFDPSYVQNYLGALSAGRAGDYVKELHAALGEAELADVVGYALERGAPSFGNTTAGRLLTVSVDEAGRQAGGRSKTWIVANPPVSAHPELNGETVPTGANFSNGQDGPPYEHPGCQCMLDISAEVAGKSFQIVVPNLPQPQNSTPGLEMLSKTFLEAQQLQLEGFRALAKALVDREPPQISVEAPQTNFAEGAIQSSTRIEPPPPANVTISEGAVLADIHNHNQPPNVVIEQAPAEVNITTPEVLVDVGAPDVTVEAPAPPPPAEVKSEVNFVTTKAGRRTVTFSDGSKAEIGESKDGKQIVKFSDGSEAEIKEGKEDDRGPDQA